MRVKNRILSHFINESDFVIRFFYCRFGFMKKAMFWHLYSSDFRQLDHTFETMKTVFEKNRVRIKDKIILELGPGNSKIIAYNFINNGAKEVILLDKYPRFQMSERQRLFQKDELEFILRKFDVSDNLIHQDNIRFISGDLCESNLTNVDIIVSNNVLEHIKNIDEVIGCMSKMVVKGGYMYHNIDFRDHFNFDSPFLFYKYEEDIWNNYLTKEGISYTNRLRYDDYMNLFEKYSFEVISEDIVRQDLDSARLSSRFVNKRKSDLEICKLKLLLRKL